MDELLNALAQMDVINRIDDFVSSFIHANWEGAYRRAGPAGVAAEFLVTLTGQNRWTIMVPQDAGWTGLEIERLLTRHGVRVWGRGFLGDCLYFSVKRRQARWTEYLLWRAGVPVVSRPFDPRNRRYAESRPQPSEPPGGGEHHSLRRGLLDALYDLFG